MSLEAHWENLQEQWQEEREPAPEREDEPDDDDDFDPTDERAIYQ